MGSAVSHVYHTNPYSKAAVNERLKQLLDDSYVSNSRGVIEYILGGERDVSLLYIRVFRQEDGQGRLSTSDLRGQGQGRVELPVVRHRA